MPWPDRVLLALTGALLVLCFLAGGSSQESGLGMTIAQLAALPVLLYALLHAMQSARFAPVLPAIGVLALIVAVPLLQLLPIPEWLWTLPASRVPLQHDLAAAGVDGVRMRWSLAPAATERDLLSLLPAAALFLAVLALNRDAWRKLLWLVVGLAAFSLVLAFVQLAVPQDSFLNPFPDFAPAMAGVFANKNHQADALAIGLVLAVSLLLDARRRDRPGAVMGLCAVLAVLFALVLPLVNSRAGVIVAMVTVATVLLGSGVVSFERLRTHRPTRLLSALTLAIFAVGVYGALAWMQTDADLAGSRFGMSTRTLALGFANAPLGGGVGSFVPLFQQGAGESMLFNAYINAAHNEYVQWWMEGGVLAVFALLAALTVLGVTLHRLLRLRPESGLRASGLAALAGVLIVVLHSSVDYPLRTPALMAVFAVLAGIAVAAAAPLRATATRPRTVASP